jgi:putative ABC transport system ATP-binding protein
MSVDEDGRVILDLEGVTKVYGSGELAVAALKEANFRVLGGEIVAVMGPSGSGKTTLLTIAGALLRPTTGNVTVCGIDVTRMNEAKLAAIRRERIGFVYQSFNLLEALTAFENVRIVLQERRNSSRPTLPSAPGRCWKCSASATASTPFRRR